ncbi:protein of unknown function [Rhodovastum atsumiense]|nr:protein of unknown function [Rhodovastum atsumiense]
MPCWKRPNSSPRPPAWLNHHRSGHARPGRGQARPGGIRGKAICLGENRSGQLSFSLIKQDGLTTFS